MVSISTLIHPFSASRKKFDEELSKARFFKASAYQSAGRELKGKPHFLPLTCTPAEREKLSAALKSDASLKETLLSLGRSGQKGVLLLEEKLSPELITDLRRALLNGNLLTKEGRLTKIMALKDVARDALSPMVALDVALLLLGDGASPASEALLLGIEALLKSTALENAARREAQYEDIYDRLRFYLLSENLTAADRNALNGISRELHQEVLTVSRLLAALPELKVTDRHRALSEAREAAALIGDSEYALLERSLKVALLFTLSEMVTTVQGTTLSYSRDWTLEDKLLAPLTSYMSGIYSSLLYRLRLYLAGPFKANPADRREIGKLLAFHEARFLPLDENLIRFLNGYRTQKSVVWKVTSAGIARFQEVREHPDTGNASAGPSHSGAVKPLSLEELGNNDLTHGV